ncbi:MAG: amidohydrolase family protein [Allosphingosinicella sp.]|uniref:amidohydrolase family protein n=1 Tax=Allosphingosinicella sp. TaxID=2823234 RepID=UPI0039582DA3
MMWKRLVCALSGLLCLGASPPASHVLIRGGHVFDGTGAKAMRADVLISGDRIVAVGPDLQAPRDSRVVDAPGMTVLPGLHDLHTHLRSPGFDAPDDLGKAYAGHLLNGVTSVNDFSVSGEMLSPIREMVASGEVAAPQLQLAIRIGVPGGHGTEYGWGDFFTMEAATPRAAELAMNRALAYQPDVIKVFADGWRYGRSPDINSMSLPTLRAIVNRAHEAGIAVITHGDAGRRQDRCGGWRGRAWPRHRRRARGRRADRTDEGERHGLCPDHGRLRAAAGPRLPSG